jgi:membrane-bound lytic murein transglycosylase D
MKLFIRQQLIWTLVVALIGPAHLASGSIRKDVLKRMSDDLFETSSIEPSTTFKTDPFSGHVLDDPQNLITKEFKVPSELKKRTAFWFDVYTRYGQDENIIHHVLYPWIVYDVVDTSAISNDLRLHKWTRYHRANAQLKKRRAEVSRALAALSKKTTFTKLSGLQKKIFNALAEVKGPRKKVFREASRNLRVQLGQKDFILKGLKHSNRYLPYMEQEFTAAGLPVELTRLPFVESSFNPYAESKVGASGIWQIMPATGKAYVRVTDHLDERNSPLKASFVAIEIFKTNFRSLRDWPLAVTAYNHGAGGVKSSLRKARATNLPDLIQRLHSGNFKFASANFYTCFLAVLHAEKYQRSVFKDIEIEKESPLQLSVYELDRRMSARQLQTNLGLPREVFVEFNLDLKAAFARNAMIPAGYKIFVPVEKRFEIDAKLSSGLKAVRQARSGD